MSKQPIPVVPAAHYQCGGIKTDVNGATSLPGFTRSAKSRALDCTARIGSPATRCWKVWWWRIARVEVMRAQTRPHVRRGRSRLPEWQSGNVQDVDELVVIYHNWDEIRRLMWDYVGHRAHR